MTETRALRLVNDVCAVEMAIQTLEDPSLTPEERATIGRIARHRLRGYVEAIRALARSQESALGRELAARRTA
jgi:hypothetical protein